MHNVKSIVYIDDSSPRVEGINSNETAVNCHAVGSNHPGGAQFGLVDGSAKFISETIDGLSLQAAVGIDDRVIQQDF